MNEKNYRRLGRLLIPARVFEQAFLPKGSNVLRMWTDFTMAEERIGLMVEHSALPAIREGAIVPQVEIEIQGNDQGYFRVQRFIA